MRPGTPGYGGAVSTTPSFSEAVSDAVSDAVDDAGGVARAAVAFVRPRLRGVLHEFAFPVSILAGVWAILDARAGSPRVATAIYAATLSACLGVSALYHRGHWSVRVRAWLRRLDHATIFLLIAGTFTPIAVIALTGWLRITTLAVVWGGVVLGNLLNLFWMNGPAALEVAPYIVMGGFGVVLMPHLLGNLGPVGVGLLALGGALYIAGAVIYAKKRPNPWPQTFGFHEIFHSLVIAAAVLQWVVIKHWVLPAG
ncbi:MAG: hemolysin III family protein [Candidatus Dormibacteraeota bacterium]|uniref:Hemolysin III family protein n=1 Tax=Candidatus Amunia macphersoniae TaxID=3127014 RepID=A0A934KLZ7_9BACT|nr:hemolysin III family protein [Candidatus Dormibacteraeota bacterium]